METVQEKLAYLRGLIAGAEFFGKDQMAKNIWNQLLEIIDDLGQEVAELRMAQEDMEDYVDAIDDDLAEIQEDVYGDDLLEMDEDEGWVDLVCPHCGDELEYDDTDLMDGDTITCSHCGRDVYVEEIDPDTELEMHGVQVD